MYNPEHQYRAAIIRGKSIREMEDVLSVYLNILLTICPCPYEQFKVQFNAELKEKLSLEREKTIDNHRTENARRILGLYWVDEHGLVRISKRALKYLGDEDGPALFKDICAKIQFPNPGQSSKTYKEHVSLGIKFMPCLFALKLLISLEERNIFPSKKELAYYLFYSLDAMRGDASIDEICESIEINRSRGIYKEVPVTNNNAFTYQHVTEILKYLDAANLVSESQDLFFKINKKESRSINAMLEGYSAGQIGFDVYKFDLNSADEVALMEREWDEYYGDFSIPNIEAFQTSVASLVDDDLANAAPSVNGAWSDLEGERGSTLDLGNEGEDFVYNYERRRVKGINPRLVNQVINFSKQKGIGFDIQSVVGEKPIPDEKIFIEVKSTRRTTKIDPDSTLLDTINLTRNEWIAARQHGKNFRIYRVYFSKSDIQIFSIADPMSKHEDGAGVSIEPTIFRLEFSEIAGEFLEA